jgi:hypothetical protein
MAQLYSTTAPQRGRQTCNLCNSPHRQPTLSSMKCVMHIRPSNSSDCRTTISCSEEEIIRRARGQNIGLYAPEPWLVCTYEHILSLCMPSFFSPDKPTYKTFSTSRYRGHKWRKGVKSTISVTLPDAMLTQSFQQMSQLTGRAEMLLLMLNKTNYHSFN